MIDNHLLNNHGRCADDNPFMPKYQISKEKAKSLGIEFIPMEVSQGNCGKFEGERVFQSLNLD